ncbi:hypothetical protein JTE90_017467 [Oedothorax gibbosus]|uniref:Uncharacterized protein n=1 Tax=Oedothorax gibbosus TaxID=931172 RepID=A0AAV6TET8_9ARAC|nr:hypothetical protein JTE90_017467 [Oedothorax gibbosus]
MRNRSQGNGLGKISGKEDPVELTLVEFVKRHERVDKWEGLHVSEIPCFIRSLLPVNSPRKATRKDHASSPKRDCLM